MNSRWAETLVFESEKRSDFRLFARSRSSRLLKSSTTCFPLQDLFERNFLSSSRQSWQMCTAQPACQLKKGALKASTRGPVPPVI